MNNGIGVPQTVVLFGGTSDIGLAIVDRVLRPGVSRLVLVSRNIDAANIAVQPIVGRRPELEVHHVPYDAADYSSVVRAVDEVAAKAGDIDLAIVAQGLLQDSDFFADPLGVVPMLDVNFTGTMVLLYALGRRLRSQGYGRIVLLSSVAGERVRRSNAAYGATKAGIDGFALALDHELNESGVSIMVVRPGFVETRMTAGMKRVPFSVTSEKVAAAVEKGLRNRSRVIWVPGVLRLVFLAFRHLPTAVWRRLPV